MEFQVGDKVRLIDSITVTGPYESKEHLPKHSYGVVKHIPFEDANYIAVDFELNGTTIPAIVFVGSLMKYRELLDNSKTSHKLEIDLYEEALKLIKEFDEGIRAYKQTDDIEEIKYLIEYPLLQMGALLTNIKQQHSKMALRKKSYYNEGKALRDAQHAYQYPGMNYIPDEYDILETAAEFLADELGIDYEVAYDQMQRYIDDLDDDDDAEKLSNAKTTTGPQNFPDPTQNSMFVNPVKYEPALTNIGKRHKVAVRKDSIKYNSKHQLDIF